MGEDIRMMTLMERERRKKKGRARRRMKKKRKEEKERGRQGPLQGQVLVLCGI